MKAELRRGERMRGSAHSIRRKFGRGAFSFILHPSSFILSAAPAAVTEARPAALRVCIVSPLPPPYGGMSVQAEKLIEGLRGEGIRVTVLRTNPDFPPGLCALARWPGVRTVLNLIRLVGALLRAIPACDIVHHLSCSHWYFFLVTVPTVGISRLFGKAVIINYRGGEAERFLARWAFAVRPVLRAGLMVVSSEFLQRIFKRFGIDSEIVPNIADLKRFTYRARTALRPRCLSTRQLEKLYNVQCALEAFQIVQQVHPEAELALAGEGRERPALERFAKDHGLRHVTFHGALDHAALATLYQQYDIFINASTADNFPGALLEAAACGLPIVSTNVGGIPYLFQNGRMAFLVAPNDPQALAERILFLLDHPDRARELAERARLECQKYAWDAVYRQWRALYQRLRAG